MGRGDTIARCMESLDIDPTTAFASAAGVDDEFKVIRKAYFKQALSKHPDKGGDPAEFRDIQSAFEVLRDFFDRGRVDTFRSTATHATDTSKTYSDAGAAFAEAERAEGGFKSWDFYAEAAGEDVPTWRVEPARSNRSSCIATGGAKKCAFEAIPQGALRVGIINLETGAYGRWRHLACWRIPAQVWEGLPDPAQGHGAAAMEEALLQMNRVLLTGLSDLNDADRDAFVAHCLDKGNWARKSNKAPPPDPFAAAHPPPPVVHGAPPPEPAGHGAPRMATAAPNAVGGYRPGGAFVVPRPGNGGVANCLAGKTCVLTGVFPEVGGGAGLNLGKDRVTAMIESFGGRVTGSISGKTDILVVGKQPGMSKVSKARANPKVTMITIHDLKLGIESGDVEAAAAPVQISSFSSGFRGNGLAALASPAEVARAAGVPVPRELEGARPAAPPPPAAGAIPCDLGVLQQATKAMMAAHDYVPRPRGTAVVCGDYTPQEKACAAACGATPAEVVACVQYGSSKLPPLKDALARNGQYKTGTKAVLLEKVIEAAARGAPAGCDLCGIGKAKMVEGSPGVFKCGGFYDERMGGYQRCPATWTGDQLKRYQWIDTPLGFGGKANPSSVPLPRFFTQAAADAYAAQALGLPQAPPPAPAAVADDDVEYVAPPPKPARKPAAKPRGRSKSPKTVPLPEDEDEAMDEAPPPKPAAKPRGRGKSKSPKTVPKIEPADEEPAAPPPPRGRSKSPKTVPKPEPMDDDDAPPPPKPRAKPRSKPAKRKRAASDDDEEVVSTAIVPAGPTGTRRSTRVRKKTSKAG